MIDITKPVRIVSDHIPVTIISNQARRSGYDLESKFLIGYIGDSAYLHFWNQQGLGYGVESIENVPEEIELFINIYKKPLIPSEYGCTIHLTKEDAQQTAEWYKNHHTTTYVKIISTKLEITD